MTTSEINVDETNAAAAYRTARESALKLSAAAGNAAMSGLRKKSDSWYKKSFASFTTYICVQSSAKAELERCVDSSSSDAVRDIDGNCVAMLDTDSCNSKGKCERRSNCKWDDVVPNSKEARRQLFTDANVTTATAWMTTGYPSSLAPFVAPGTVMGVLTALACIGFVILRCAFNRCGGREPNEKGYSRCDILMPTLTFLVCSLAVFICMVITAALNTNISDGVENVLYSLKATLENANIFVANLLVPLKKAATDFTLVSSVVDSQFKDSDWIVSDGATLKQMIADFGGIYYNHASFPSGTCDPKTSTTFCMACPEKVCGSPVSFFRNNSTAAMAVSSNVIGDMVSMLQTALVSESSALNTKMRTAALDIAAMGAMTNSSLDVVNVISTTFDDLSFSRSALVVSVFFFGMIASIVGIIAIAKNMCTAKTTHWVHLLHVSWALGVLVCVLSFVLSASLLAVGAVWYDSCEYMRLLHEDLSPYAATQMSSMANACFNGSSILAPLGLETPLSFSCNVEEEYATLQAADMTSLSKLITNYGDVVSNYDLTDFNFNSTLSRSLVTKLTAAAIAANKKPIVAFTQENILTPWLAYNEASSSKYDCSNITSEDIPVCYMTGVCNSGSSDTNTTHAACQTSFSNAYAYMLAFKQVRTMLDEMREALLGDTGTSFPAQWNYSTSITEFTTTYFTKLNALKIGSLNNLLGDNGAVRALLTTVEQARCSGDCAWANLSFESVHESLCEDVLGTTLAISLSALFLSLFLIPLIISAILLQKRLRGVAKGTYDQLERRLQELERRAKQQKAETEGLSPNGESPTKRGGLSSLGAHVAFLATKNSFLDWKVATQVMAARDVVILGGGISGLTLAFFLRQALPKAVAEATRIRVLDANSISGGWVHTAKSDDFLFEEGPRGFRPSRNGAEMLRLVEQLKLQEQMQAVDPAAQARYILRNGKVEKLPTSLLEALRWPLSPAVARAALRELFVKPGSLQDESVYNFMVRRFSPVVAERLVDPMASGIFGGDIRKLSMRSCFSMLVDLEQKHGSVVKGMLLGGPSSEDTLLDGTKKSDFIKKHEKSVSVSFTDGMSTLMQTLEDSITADPMSEMLLNTKVTRLGVHGHSSKSLKAPMFTVESKDPKSGEFLKPIKASHVFSTIPACYLAPAVKDSAPGLAEALSEIKFADMGMVHVGYNEKVLPSDGFGYLVPTTEHEKVLGVVFDSNTFPVQNASNKTQTRLSVMSGGAHFPEVASLPKKQLELNALDALKRHLGISRKPDYVRAMALTNGIPQYHVGFGQTLERIEKQAARSAPGLYLGGNSFYGIGLADCVTHSKQLALNFAKSVSS
ncbi:hypothetical protein BBO99_00001738 [Phytophthora kernoviae]|uniref:protoporphyrinogen oxidase n=2 Tax=Phytophthora kernoviae TaxID=325452 RepID=A0A3R7MTE5_9STRA|nr:hypothetical protein G195_002279 [Phytophthora kernoviae 00238/432]KAG2530910.1 hypothetical protein JM16_001411 [Phytophthora kernoviae]KAG2531983.1 hypothetical protein JM18_001493 [Phytophthora kernoviae]RLN36754.1 hypothetical protein BBI17_001509 [Phytophthora kernoviae]RLN83880.1 hypothetical protein BBO99_00001738 [Phytophthora kernoviae]